MIKDHQAPVESNSAIRDLQVVHGMTRETGLDEALQVVTPKTKDAAQGKRKVDLIENLAALGQRAQDGPGIAELDLPRAVIASGLAPGPHGLEGLEGASGDHRIASRGDLEHPCPKDDPSGFVMQGCTQ